MQLVPDVIVFEISVEAARKGTTCYNLVGGVYTVLRTKCPFSVQKSSRLYFLIGIVSLEFEFEFENIETDIDSFEITNIIRSLNELEYKFGIKYKFGRWLVDENPFIILFDISSFFSDIHRLKHQVLHELNIPWYENDIESDNTILFGTAVYNFLDILSKNIGGRKIAAHFHEWLSSLGLVLCHINNVKVATIFTTHATILGRYLCAGEVDFYNHLENFNVDYESGRLNIYHRYCFEKAAAFSADVFTSVSHITAYESKCILKKAPGKILMYNN